MIDADPTQFSGDFNVALPKNRQSPGMPLHYCVIAAQRQPSGAVHTYVGPQVLTGETGSSDCDAGLQAWVTREGQLQTTPDSGAWTELSVTTVNNKSSNGNLLSDTVGVYRANSSNTQTDYYMITKQADIQPNYSHCTWGGSCGWYSLSRNLTIQTDIPASPNYSLSDHGPTSQNNVTTASFSIGGSVSGLTPGVSASYSQSWNQQDVTTSDNTNLNTNVASWSDRFSQSWSTWTANPPNAIKGLWQSNQAAIYAIPVGTASFTVEVNDSGHFQYDTGFELKGDTVTLDFFVPVGPPTLSISPSSLKVLPGQHVTFDISASIPGNTGENLSWIISNVPSGLNLNTTTGAGSQMIKFDIPSNATPGTLATFNINSVPVYASPDVRTGPLQLPITVVSNSAPHPGVLITGGLSWNDVFPLSSAEVWNPVTQTSTQVGNMTEARMLHTATAIANGEVFVAGGVNGSQAASNTTELFNGATQEFTAGPDLAVARASHTATLLTDGTVLIAGGYDQDGNVLSSAELYDPVSNSLSPTGQMSVARAFHTATMLLDGRVLIAGGSDSDTAFHALASAEIYDPKTKTFSPTGSMNVAVQSHAATLLPNGQVLIARGQNSAGPSTTLMLYTPASGSFSVDPSGNNNTGSINAALVTLPPQAASADEASALLIDGAGPNQNWALLRDTRSGTLFAPSIMQEARDQPQAVALQNTNSNLDGCILVVGGVIPQTGESGGTTIEVWHYNLPQANEWTSAGKMTTSRSGHTATLFGVADASVASAPR